MVTVLFRKDLTEVFVVRLLFSFNRLTDKYFSKSPWPEAESIASIVEGGKSGVTVTPSVPQVIKVHFLLSTPDKRYVVQYGELGI